MALWNSARYCISPATSDGAVVGLAHSAPLFWPLEGFHPDDRPALAKFAFDVPVIASAVEAEATKGGTEGDAESAAPASKAAKVEKSKVLQGFKVAPGATAPKVYLVPNFVVAPLVVQLANRRAPLSPCALQARHGASTLPDHAYAHLVNIRARAGMAADGASRSSSRELRSQARRTPPL